METAADDRAFWKAVHSPIDEATLHLFGIKLNGRVPALSKRLQLLSICRKRLREERARGLQGSWAYDLTRHGQMLARYRRLAQEALRETLTRKAEAAAFDGLHNQD